MPNSVVTLDLAAGVAQLAGSSIAVRARPGGALYVGGRVIRPLSFGERWRVIDDASAAESPLGATVLAHASEPEAAGETQPVDDERAQVIALHLAGARPERTVPGFAAQLARLLAAGWAPRDVLDADADLVDLLTAEAPGDAVGGEWTSIVVGQRGPASTTVAETLRTLERNLLDRIGSTEPDEHSPEPDRPQRLGSEHPSSADFPGSAPAEPTWSSRDGSAPTSSAPELVPLVAAQRGGADSPALVTPSVTDGFVTPGSTPGLPLSVPQPIRLAWSDQRATVGRAAPDRLGAPALGPRVEDRPRPPGLPASGAGHIGGSAAVPAALPTPSSLGSASPHRARLAGTPTASTVVDDAPFAGRTAPAATPRPPVLDVFGLADQLAALLDDESDLRGLRR